MKRALLLGIAALLSARAHGAQELPPAQSPYGQVELLAQLEVDIRTDYLQRSLARRGIGFQPTGNYIQDLKAAGAPDSLLDAVRAAPVRPAIAAGTKTKLDGQVLTHLVKAARDERSQLWNDAASEIHAALKIEPDNPYLHLCKANFLFMTFHASAPSEREAELREALSIDPDCALAHLMLAGDLLEMGKEEDAASEFREAVRFDPYDADTCYRLGTLLDKLGDTDGAIAAYKKAVALEPQQIDFHLSLANDVEKEGDFAGAMAQANLILQIDPNDADAHNILGLALHDEGKPEEANKEYQWYNNLKSQNAPKRIRVSGPEEMPKLLHVVTPVYPSGAQAKRLQGIVSLDIVIGVDGTVTSLKVTGGEPVLAKAATHAVSKWRFAPTLLDGKPVEVETDVTVNFNLTRYLWNLPLPS